MLFFKPKPKLNQNLIEDKSFYQDLVLAKLASKIKNASKNGFVSVCVSNAELNDDIIKVLQKKGLKIDKTKSNNFEIYW